MDGTSPLRLVGGRAIAALLNPRPVVLIGASHEDEVDFAAVAWISPVSHTPPLLAFALRGTSYTFRLIERTGWCSVNVPDAAHLGIVTFCGNTSGSETDKKGHVPFRLLKDSAYRPVVMEKGGQYAGESEGERPADGQVADGRRESEQREGGRREGGQPTDNQRARLPELPLLEGACSVLFARTLSTTPTGDHMLVVAEVVAALSRCPEDDKGRTIALDTLLCLQHDLFTTAGTIVEAGL